ncbi:MAG: hypothetical protein ACOC6E_00960 [Thermodesulfobacteriota bacterium]
MEILRPIPVTLDHEEIKTMLHLGRRKDWNQIRSLMDRARDLIEASAAYSLCYLEEKLEDMIKIGGVYLKSKVLRRNLDQAERIFPFVLTIGGALERETKACSDILEQYYLDSIGNAALESVRSFLEDHLRSRYALVAISSLSPGSLDDWSLENQRSLFSILGDVHGAIGVKLEESLVMSPSKSISGIYFPTEIPFYSCQLCARERCPSRKAEFDERLAREYGLV